MAPLAVYLSQAGYEVSGYDDCLQDEVKLHLKRNGVQLKDVPPAKTSQLVYSTAIARNHPFVKDQDSHQCHQRGNFLAGLLNERKLVAVVGSHGKTTTTGMLIHLLDQLDFSFGYLLGGLFRDPAQSPARYSESDWVVAEVDESDCTIKQYKPEITLALNLNWDHKAHYPEEEDLETAFQTLFRNTRGCVIIPKGCERLKRLAQSATCPVIYIEEPTGSLPFAEAFNRENAQAALTAATAMGASVADSNTPFEGFSGIWRRQEPLYQDTQRVVLADYAHHPVEIQAFMDYAQGAFDQPLIAIFQPHRFTRTEQFHQAFANILERADSVILLPVYAASESASEKGKTDRIYEALAGKHSCVTLLDSLEALEGLHLEDRGPATFLFIGAGDIYKQAESFAQTLQEKHWWPTLATQVSPDTHLGTDMPLGDKTTLRVGGNTRYSASPANPEDLATILKTARQAQVPLFILGRGSNVVVCAKGFAGLTVRLNHDFWKTIERLDGERLFVRAGTRLRKICGQACKWGLGGFEFLEGIPGTLGGALRMNAGAFDGWMFDVIESVELMTLDGERKTLPKEAFNVGYRYCEDLKHAIALGAVLKSPTAVEESLIRDKIDQFCAHRRATQPREPSAGCMFKNPEGNSAGKLIDELGLKGFKVGSAEISTVHGNFLVNQGGATAEDVLTLVRTVRKRIQDHYGITLNPEPLLIGQSWENVL